MNIKDSALKRWEGRQESMVHDSFLQYSEIGTQAKSIWADKSEQTRYLKGIFFFPKCSSNGQNLAKVKVDIQSLIGIFF